MEVIVWGATDEKVDDLVEKIIARSETWKNFCTQILYWKFFAIWNCNKRELGLSFEFISISQRKIT